MKEYCFKLREEIIHKLSISAGGVEGFLACWLWGSDANNEVDEYSDIDMFFIVKDDFFEEAFDACQKKLLEIWEFDYISDLKIEGSQTWKYFHIAWTPECLLIEIWLIKESDWMTFPLSHSYFKPKVLFDKCNFIKYVKQDEKELKENINRFIKEQEELFIESSRVKVYINRKNYIEATNYYIKFAYLPLVWLLRVKYTPELYNWGRIHISRHFPKTELERLEDLMRFTSINDLEKNINSINDWFNEVLNDIKTK